MRSPDRRFAPLQILFAVTFLVAAIAAAAQFWGNDRSYYASFASEAHLDRVRFHSHYPVEGADRALSLDEVLRVDDATRSFVLCDQCFFDSSFPAGFGGFYMPDEIGHLDDVRRVFGMVRTGGVVGAIVAVVAAFGVSRRRVRRTLFVTAAGVVLFGLVASFAFEPLFLAFHQIFFPQGNFLFDPATDNLVLVYPEAYWLGVTLRLGVMVVLLCLFVGTLVDLPIRSRRRAF